MKWASRVDKYRPSSHKLYIRQLKESQSELQKAVSAQFTTPPLVKTGKIRIVEREYMSLTADMQQIDRQVKGVLRTIQHDELDREEAKLVKQLKQLCNEARLDVRDYEYAETREVQAKAGVAAHKSLTSVEKCIVRLSGIFGPADVAELSARVDQIRSRL